MQDIQDMQGRVGLDKFKTRQGRNIIEMHLALLAVRAAGSGGTVQWQLDVTWIPGFGMYHTMSATVPMLFSQICLNSPLNIHYFCVYNFAFLYLIKVFI